MNRRLEQDIRRWLEAEARARAESAERATAWQEEKADELAEEALFRLFRGLDRGMPTPGFADRVLLRSGYVARAPWLWRSRWIRVAVAASILVAGLAAVTLPAWWLIADPVGRILGGQAILAVSRGAARWMSGASQFLAILVDVATALRAALVTDTATAILVANALLAAISLSGLRRLLKASEESLP